MKYFRDFCAIKNDNLNSMTNRERFGVGEGHFKKRAAALEHASSKLFEIFEGVEKLGQKIEVVGTKEIRDINQ